MSVEHIICGGVFLLFMLLGYFKFVQPFFREITYDVVNHLHED